MRILLFCLLCLLLSLCAVSKVSEKPEEFGHMYLKRMEWLYEFSKNSSLLNVNWILDVGANKGDWAHFIKRIFKAADVFMIEANPLLEERLSATGFDYAISLVGDENKQVDFHVHKDYSTGGSIFREDGYKYRAEKKIDTSSRKMRRIDDVVRGKGPFEIMKLDIQGAELMALVGASETMKGAQVVLLEVALQQYNRGSPSFADINHYLESQGFAMFDILELRHQKYAAAEYETYPALVQFDVMWVRRGDAGGTLDLYSFPPPPKPLYHCTLG
mmetsp:Transcript_15791/g.34431  ORF Transcript_15791/g.34431 Transcript_15791/m.34431 type:complete len:273 (+) Transcript_15791:169-987(+)